jgi:hypothetical protein
LAPLRDKVALENRSRRWPLAAPEKSWWMMQRSSREWSRAALATDRPIGARQEAIMADEAARAKGRRGAHASVRHGDGQRAVGKRLNFTQLGVPIELSDCVRDAISASELRKKPLSCMDKITTHGSDNLKDVDFGKIQDLMKHALTSSVQEQVLKPKKDSEGLTKHDSSLSKII